MSIYSDVVFNLSGKRIRGIHLPIKDFPNINVHLSSFTLDDFVDHARYLKEDFVVREDDIYICTYPRSGTNWTYEMVKMLANRNSNYVSVFPVLEGLNSTKLESIQSPRVVCSHLPYDYLPPRITEKAKLIHVSRNPKDVAVSLHNYFLNVSFLDYHASWEQFLQLFLDGEVCYGNWFDHVLGWEKFINEKNSDNIFTVKFEDLKDNLREKVEQLSNFLGFQPNPKLISDIVEKCGFKNLYKEKCTNVPREVAALAKNKSNILYRKGEVGDWKNFFTVKQNEQFDKIYKERMKDSKLKYRFS